MDNRNRKIVRINNQRGVSKNVRIPALDSDQKDIQKWFKYQKYKKGFGYTSKAGVTNTESPVLGGEVRFLYGITLYFNTANIADEDTFSLQVNQEKIVDEVIWWDLNPQGAVGNLMKEFDYFSTPRPMSGSDSIEIQLKSVNAHNYYIVFTLADGIPE